MNSRSRQNLQKMFLMLVILCLIFPLGSLVLNTPSFQSNKYTEEDQSEKLHISAMTNLNHDEWEETHGSANDYIFWSFSTSPSQVINVWVLTSSEYSSFISSGFATGYHQTTSASGSGSFDVSSYLKQTWYVLFWNDESGSQSTTLSYFVYFHDDTLTPDITVTEPTSSSNYVRDRDYTVRWTSISAGVAVKIELFKENLFYSTLVTNTRNDGQELVHIPSSCLESSNYSIKITSISYPVFGFSANFTIQPYKYCRVISPDLGEVYKPGDVIPITWETNCQSTEVEIELKTFDDWDYIYYIDMNALNNGNYNWTITAQDLPETERWFFITVRPTDCTANITASRFFTIQKPPTIPTIPTISSYNVSIVIWTGIWITIAAIIFIKKKYHNKCIVI